MSNPNPERDERLNQIRERADLPSRWTPTWADVNFLLSLLDSQAALARELAIIVDVATDEDPGTSLSKLHKIQHDAATLMRDRCVDAIKTLRATPRGAAYGNAISDAIHKVEALTLEGGGGRRNDERAR